jgi:hypothetical protein
LKVLSDAIFAIYDKTLKKQDFSSDRIQFFAEKSELINNLQNEFITPLERGDIFLLEENITEELNSVFALQEYLGLIKVDDFYNIKNINISFKSQCNILSQLSNYKNNLKLFEQCSNEIKHLNSDKKNIEKNITYTLKCDNEQPLIKYAVYSASLDLNRKIHKTILETERILINNS